MKAKLAKEAELLADISKAFAESLDLEETLASILRSLDTHLKLRRGTIALLDAETETINTRVPRPWPATKLARASRAWWSRAAKRS